MNKFSIIMIVAIVGFIGLLFFLRQDSIPEGTPSNHILGAGTSGVTLIEYGDFQCPACGQYWPILQAVKEIYGDEISFQHRHFPLIGNFQNNMAAHRSAEAAGQQDQFYEMHDLLYERQASWSNSNNAREVFEGYAEELGLDMERFREDYTASETLATINADRNIASEKDVTATPSFFINEERIENPRTVEEFVEIIDEYIERETGAPSQNSPRSQDEGFEFDEFELDDDIEPTGDEEPAITE